MKPSEPNENHAAPADQEAPAVSPLFQRDTSKDLVPYPRKPLSPKASRERIAQEQAARKERPLTHLGPGHPDRRARQQKPAPDADQAPAPPRRFVWQHESDVPTPPMKKRGPRDPRNIG